MSSDDVIAFAVFGNAVSGHEIHLLDLLRAQLMNIALDDGLLERGSEPDEVFGVSANAYDQVLVLFGMHERVLQLFRRIRQCGKWSWDTPP